MMIVKFRIAVSPNDSQLLFGRFIVNIPWDTEIAIPVERFSVEIYERRITSVAACILRIEHVLPFGNESISEKVYSAILLSPIRR